MLSCNVFLKLNRIFFKLFRPSIKNKFVLNSRFKHFTDNPSRETVLRTPLIDGVFRAYPRHHVYLFAVFSPEGWMGRGMGPWKLNLHRLRRAPGSDDHIVGGTHPREPANIIIIIKYPPYTCTILQ